MTNVSPIHQPSVHLEPPDCLTDDQAQVWRETVTARAADYFQPDVAPLLEEYCRVVVMCRALALQVEGLMAGDEDGNLEKVLRLRDMESKRLTSIATKLRITNQSRYNPLSANTAAKKGGGGGVWQFGAKKTGG